MRMSNMTVEPIGVSRLALFRVQRRERLTPVAHLFVRRREHVEFGGQIF